MTNESSSPLHVHVRGPSRATDTIVLIHGAPSTVAHFERLTRALVEDGLRVVVPELPGYGASPRLRPYVLERAHTLVEDALIVNGVDDAVVLGFSGGVYHGAAIAARGRIRVRGLYALAGGIHFESARAELLAIAQLLETPNLDAGPILVARMLGPRGQVDSAACADVASWMDTTTTESLRDEMEAFAYAPDVTESFVASKTPFVCRVGTDDASGAAVRAPKMIVGAPHGTLEWVQGAGHALLLEDFDDTLASIRRFVRALA